MTSIGKYLAYTIMVALVLFVVVAKALPEVLDKFISLVTTILAICVGGAVVYIIIKLKKS
jgi:hypothetical protein